MAWALIDLIRLWKPVGAAVRSLASYPWDSTGLVELRVTDIANALRVYEAGSISDEELEAWAEAIEGRDDVDLDPRDESTLKEFLFEVSTPEVNGRFDRNRSAAWRDRLRSEGATTSGD